jgi:hypothetical protein
LRAFTPRDQAAVRAAAETFRPNPKIRTEAALTELAVGEALVSLLDEKGQPAPVERALILPPRSQIGPIAPAQRRALIEGSLVFGTYEKEVDRESAYERLQAAHASPLPAQASSPPAKTSGFFDRLFGGGESTAGGSPPLPAGLPRGRGGRQPESLTTVMAKSAVRTIGSTIGREVIRGVLGSIFGGSRRR